MAEKILDYYGFGRLSPRQVRRALLERNGVNGKNISPKDKRGTFAAVAVAGSMVATACRLPSAPEFMPQPEVQQFSSSIMGSERFIAPQGIQPPKPDLETLEPAAFDKQQEKQTPDTLVIFETMPNIDQERLSEIAASVREVVDQEKCLPKEKLALWGIATAFEQILGQDDSLVQKLKSLESSHQAKEVFESDPRFKVLPARDLPDKKLRVLPEGTIAIWGPADDSTDFDVVPGEQRHHGTIFAYISVEENDSFEREMGSNRGESLTGILSEMGNPAVLVLPITKVEQPEDTQEAEESPYLSDDSEAIEGDQANQLSETEGGIDNAGTDTEETQVNETSSVAVGQTEMDDYFRADNEVNKAIPVAAQQIDATTVNLTSLPTIQQPQPRSTPISVQSESSKAAVETPRVDSSRAAANNPPERPTPAVTQPAKETAASRNETNPAVNQGTSVHANPTVSEPVNSIPERVAEIRVNTPSKHDEVVLQPVAPAATSTQPPKAEGTPAPVKTAEPTKPADKADEKHDATQPQSSTTAQTLSTPASPAPTSTSHEASKPNPMILPSTPAPIEVPKPAEKSEGKDKAAEAEENNTQDDSDEVVPETPEEYREIIIAEAKKNGVTPLVLSAMLSKESGGFNKDVIAGRRRSPAGASGIAQFMKGTADKLGIDRNDPNQAIPGAAKYLGDNIEKFSSVTKGLAAYNAGPGNVEKAGGVPKFAETQNYIAAIRGRVGDLEAQRVEKAEPTPKPAPNLTPEPLPSPTPTQASNNGSVGSGPGKEQVRPKEEVKHKEEPKPVQVTTPAKPAEATAPKPAEPAKPAERTNHVQPALETTHKPASEPQVVSKPKETTPNPVSPAATEHPKAEVSSEKNGDDKKPSETTGKKADNGNSSVKASGPINTGKGRDR